MGSADGDLSDSVVLWITAVKESISARALTPVWYGPFQGPASRCNAASGGSSYPLDFAFRDPTLDNTHI